MNPRFIISPDLIKLIQQIIDSMDQAEQVRTLYVVIDYMIQKINDLNVRIGDMEKIIKSLQEENVTLNDNVKEYEKKFTTVENFVEICTDQMPRLLTRLVVGTQSDDLVLSLNETIRGLESNVLTFKDSDSGKK